MWLTYSEVVKGGVRQATSCNVFGQLVQHLWVLGLRHQYKTFLKTNTCTHKYTICGFTYMHGQYTAGDEFTVLSDAEVPRLYSHHVVKHELQVQAALYTHLHKIRELRSVYNSTYLRNLVTGMM